MREGEASYAMVSKCQIKSRALQINSLWDLRPLHNAFLQMLLTAKAAIDL